MFHWTSSFGGRFDFDLHNLFHELLLLMEVLLLVELLPDLILRR